eukprot:12422478-Karenia_brevis.AAC.1
MTQGLDTLQSTQGTLEATQTLDMPTSIRSHFGSGCRQRRQSTLCNSASPPIHDVEDPVAAGEETGARMLKAPVKPTPEMVELHNQTHLPFRSWCRYCVRGRGRSMGHTRVDHGEEQIPTVSIDYGFLGTKDNPATDLPVLVGKDRLSQTVWASPVPCKGVEDHPHGSNRLREWLDETGYKRVIVKSDQEPAIRAVVSAVKNAWPNDLIPEAAPKESHERSNGEAEVTVQQVHGLARTLKEHVEDRCG